MSTAVATIGHSSGDQPPALPRAEDFNRLRVELRRMEAQKRELAKEISEKKRAHYQAGGSRTALRIILMIEALDPDEREAVMHEVDAYATFLRFW